MKGLSFGPSAPNTRGKRAIVLHAITEEGPIDDALLIASEARDISNKFFDLTGIPGLVGAIDGTHCRIQAPSDREFEFVNRQPLRRHAKYF
ncbi:hypothetical protein QR680_012741 [Steinernema hermaphroditum]|uniref:DDE Tnp4 domain-containing protein n=1 Tax=Steinernema hermaphroditum TaxID=289476 RepID=A0AA39M192_9BILA|nr:hypothetical protein QR680_012741 [Steinernema hermaphroditum]